MGRWALPEPAHLHGAGASSIVVSHRTSTKALESGPMTSGLGWDMSKGQTKASRIKLPKYTEGERRREGERVR